MKKSFTKEEAIEHVCATVALVYHTIGDYSEPSDGFCRKCPSENYHDMTFKNNGHVLRYVRAAVVERLESAGHTIPEEFQIYVKDTGEEFEDA